MEQKVALITGASKGIGASCAYKLDQEGYTVAIHYRSSEEVAIKLASTLKKAKIFRFNLEDESSCEDLIKAVKKEFGGIDLLVNNAGVSADQVLPFAKITDFTKLVSTNLKPVFLLSKLASRLMIRKKSGNIINITSVVGHTGNAGQSIYASTKSAINGFTKSIALDLAPFGIRCNCVAPGFIQTDMTEKLSGDIKESILAKIPLKRFGRSEEVADAVAFLASDKSSFITGTTLHVNGGMFLS